MPLLDTTLINVAEIDILKTRVLEMEKTIIKLDKLVNQHSKSLADLLIRLSKLVLSNNGNSGNSITDYGGFRGSQGQVLAEAAAAILRASRRNI